MGGVCLCYARTCRPLWPIFIILASIPCMMHCSESPAAGVGKMYPRGNHWAVGHLMGKKSIETLPELQQANPDSDYLIPPETEPGRYERLMEALAQQNNLKQLKAQIAGRLLQVGSGWREEDRDKYLREMPNLLLLALKLQDNDST